LDLHSQLVRPHAHFALTSRTVGESSQIVKGQAAVLLQFARNSRVGLDLIHAVISNRGV